MKKSGKVGASNRNIRTLSRKDQEVSKRSHVAESHTYNNLNNN